jgi:microcystin-dependent protein
LFSAIGTLYGTGDGSTTFNLPDLQGRVPVGRRADGTGTFAALNNRGGAEAVTLNLTQIPPHTHTQNSHSHSVSGSTNTTGDHNHRYNTNSSNAVFTTAGGTGMDRKLTPNNATTTTNGNHNHGFSGTTSAVAAENLNEGGSQPHNNLQPYIALNYIIKT